MNDLTPSVPPPPRAPAVRPSTADVEPTALQATLTFVGGLVLAAGSCAGFLGTLNLNRESAINIAFAIGFVVSLLASFGGVVLIVLRQVRIARGRRAAALGAIDARPDAQVGGPLPAVPGRAVAGTDRGSAWNALVVAGVLLAAAVGFVVLLVATDPNPVAFLFLVLSAGSTVGSLVFLVVAGIRYSRGH